MIATLGGGGTDPHHSRIAKQSATPLGAIMDLSDDENMTVRLVIHHRHTALRYRSMRAAPPLSRAGWRICRHHPVISTLRNISNAARSFS
jgi:hypothetical protein